LNSLNKLGWNSYFEENFKSYNAVEFRPARITAENKNNYLLITEHGEVFAEVTGKLLFNSDTSADLPKTGDWVVISLHNENTSALIHDILPRISKISRKTSGKRTDEQIIAVNIDLIFVIQSLDNNLNLNRLRRYLVAMNESGAEVIILLSKTDLDPEAEIKAKEIKMNFPDNEVIPFSALLNSGIEVIKNKLSGSKTAVVLGSSGVGKSTLINKLLGQELLKASEVRLSDSKGKHTTTRRELFLLPDGGMIIDTPGMRELALWNAGEGLSKTFSAFDELAYNCYFSDCTHTHEIRCAVLEALQEGRLTNEEYESYIKLRKELKYLESKQDKFLQLEEKRKWKSIHKEMKNFNKKNKI